MHRSVGFFLHFLAKIADTFFQFGNATPRFLGDFGQTSSENQQGDEEDQENLSESRRIEKRKHDRKDTRQTLFRIELLAGKGSVEQA